MVGVVDIADTRSSVCFRKSIKQVSLMGTIPQEVSLSIGCQVDGTPPPPVLLPVLCRCVGCITRFVFSVTCLFSFWFSPPLCLSLAILFRFLCRSWPTSWA